jgi:hypothetical protein
MIGILIGAIILLLIIFFLFIIYFGVKFIRNRPYALVPNQDRNIDDVYIQFV